VSGVRLPLVLSVAGHALGLFLLVWLSARLSPPVLFHPPTPNAVAVIFEAPPPPVAPPAPPPPIPPPPAEVKPPPPPPPPPPPASEVKPPPPPEVKPPPEPPRRPPPPRREVRRPIERRVEPRPPTVEPRPVAPPPVVTLPPPVRQPPAAPPPAPIVSAAYRGALAQWFASHKRYPESARERGEQGEALLRFRVDRSGRVLSYSLVRGTGYPDLDAQVEAMMQGAVLPAFPSDMAASDIEVSVPVRFSLVR